MKDKPGIGSAGGKLDGRVTVLERGCADAGPVRLCLYGDSARALHLGAAAAKVLDVGARVHRWPCVRWLTGLRLAQGPARNFSGRTARSEAEGRSAMLGVKFAPEITEKARLVRKRGSCGCCPTLPPVCRDPCPTSWRRAGLVPRTTPAPARAGR